SLCFPCLRARHIAAVLAKACGFQTDAPLPEIRPCSTWREGVLYFAARPSGRDFVSRGVYWRLGGRTGERAARRVIACPGGGFIAERGGPGSGLRVNE